MLNSWERFRDARITDNKHGRQTMDEVAAATGVSKNMISRLEKDPRSDNDKPESESGVKWQAVAKLARHYGVSADYLMGLSEVKTPDINIRAMCDILGLSEQTISTLTLANRARHEAQTLTKYKDIKATSDFLEARKQYGHNQVSDDPSYLVTLAHILSDGLLQFADEAVLIAMNDTTLAERYFCLTYKDDSTPEYNAATYLTALGAAYNVNKELISANDSKRFAIYEITTVIGNYLRSRYIEGAPD